MSSKTIQEWCDSHRYSRSFFYVLEKAGKSPLTFKVGTTRRISEEADAQWVKDREAESVKVAS
jgi:hypothetical protein